MHDRPIDLGSELLAELKELRALARALVGGSEDAEDVVQATVAAALERPPRRGGDLRGWLRGVARNLVRFARRSDRRRREREERARLDEERAPAADPAAAAERVELLALIMDELRHLPDPCRSTLLLRYFEDLAPAEIAARLRVPAATVRSWLKRGLERLRARLDRRVERPRWVAALLPWAFAGPPRSLPRAARVRRAMPAPATGALAVLLIVGASVMDRSRRRGDDAAPSGSAIDPSVARADDRIDRAPPDPPSPAVARRPLRTAESTDAGGASGLRSETPPRRSWTIRGRLLGLRESAPWTTRLQIAAASSEWEETLPFAEAEVDRDGAFVADLTGIDDACAGLTAIVVSADDPRYVAASRVVELGRADGSPPDAVAAWTADLRVVVAAVVTGRVIDARGHGLAGVDVQSTPLDSRRALHWSRVDTHTDAEGRFRIRAPSGGRHRVAALSFPALRSVRGGDGRRCVEARRGLRPAAIESAFEVGREVALADLVLADGVAIHGRVVDGAGAPVDGAIVFAERSRPVKTDLLDEPRLFAAQSARDGTFELDGLERRAYRLRVADHAAGALLPELARAGRETIESEAPAQDVELRFTATRVDVEVRGAEGPIAGASVTISASSAAGGAAEAACASTSEDGVASFLLPSDRRFPCTVRHDSFRACTKWLRTTGTAQQETILLEPAPPRPSLRLKLSDASGHQVRCASIYASRPGAEPDRGVWLLCAAEGSEPLLVSDLDAGAWRLEVHAGSRQPGGAGFFVAETLELEVPREGVRDVDLTVRGGGRLDLRALDPEGRGVEAACTLRDREGVAIRCLWVWHASTWIASATELWPDGFVSPDRALAPGSWSLELSQPGLRTLTVPFEIVEGRTTTVEATLARE